MSWLSERKETSRLRKKIEKEREMDREIMTEAIGTLPDSSFAFAYGSSVLRQDHNPGGMLDVILAVEDPVKWHRENMALNPKHYSFPRPEWIQHWGPGVYFNTHIPIAKNREMKYGVVGTAALLEDLEEWRWLYLAGRLHKPVVILNRADQLIEGMMCKNRDNAVDTALKFLPERFDALELYAAIASLSYAGDVRMAVGAEDPTKVANIVRPNLEVFDKLYAPSIQKHPDIAARGNGRFERTRILAPRREIDLLGSTLRSRVRRASAIQAIKGLLSAGPGRSFSYVAAKLAKGRRLIRR